jgi:predicted nucleic acid-binding protein
MEWVLDASVAISWCFDDERTPHSEGLLDHLRAAPAVVPQIWRLEVANALISAVRHGRITREERSGFIEMLVSHPVQTDRHTDELALGAIVALAEQYGLTSHDASYLELSLRMGLPLATLDTQLQAAARKAGVALL